MNKLIEELTRFSRWVCWVGRPVKTPDGERISKILGYIGKDNKYHNAAINRPETWGTYEQARSWVKRILHESRKGVGFVLGVEQGQYHLVCIDLDHCLNEADKTFTDDEAGKRAAHILDIFTKNGEKTYTEFSPSGTGLHIYGWANMPYETQITKPIEIYWAKHYMTVTGQPYMDIPVSTIQKSVDEVIKEYCPFLDDSPAASKSCSPSDAPPCEGPKLSDEEVIEKIMNSRSGPKFQALYYQGDTSIKGDDQSSADQVLFSMLAYRTEDEEQIERIFLHSKLAETLDRKKGHEQDYLNRSIKKALDFVREKRREKAEAARKQAEEGPAFSLDSQKKPIKCVENLSILLKSKGISIQKNIVTKSVDVMGSKELESLDYNAQAIKIRNMTKLSHLNLSKQDTNDFLDLIANENSYSPVCDYLMDCYNDYDGGDYISPLFNMLSLDTDIPQDVDFCKNLFIKWLLECAIIPFNRKTMRKLATQQGVLTLVGGQGVGKTRFPLNTILKDKPEYLITGETIDPKDKDSVLRAIGCWIFELSEFSESSTAKQQDALKSFIDRGKDKIRPPYAAKAIDEPRTCVFYATTNRTEFMHDPTGGRRWWPLAITKINIDEDFNARQLWGQVMHLWKDEHEEPYPLTEEETKELAKHNNNFSAQSDAELAISEYLDFDMPQDKWKWVSPAGLSNGLNHFFINRSYKPEATGRALTAMCRKNPAIEKRRGRKGIEYLLPLPAFFTSDNHKEKNAPAPTQEEPDFTSDMSED
ncbi:VapE domain-containing protein [uncultured Dialister sp.]|uniref:phage NrS-1 polymerase family protein n=1 Tax=uncultured Dialister sp. TaxID=278064 RepID=UPI0026DACC3A|nr:VapE domain-containing protein [uncultured Dialister sp.]